MLCYARKLEFPLIIPLILPSQTTDFSCKSFLYHEEILEKMWPSLQDIEIVALYKKKQALLTSYVKVDVKRTKLHSLMLSPHLNTDLKEASVTPMTICNFDT